MKIKLFVTTLFTATFFLITKAQYTKLLDLAGLNGYLPQGSFISDGAFLYGMTQYGGINDMGVIFKIKPDGTGYTVLLDFDSINGSSPYGSLFFDGSFLYGMTQYGGAKDYGVIFKIKPDGTGYAKLLDFTFAANGAYPKGSVISDGAFLYGVTQGGGTNNRGVIFKIMPDGTGYVKLLDFSVTASDMSPVGSLIFDGTFLYGMTYLGGTNNGGAIFKIMPDGTGYSKLLDFSGTANGRTPLGSLISDGTFLYAMTSGGGTNHVGTIFKIKPDGTDYSKLLDFAGAANGGEPRGSLISDGSFLYGMTFYGGPDSLGVIFKIKPDGTGYSKLLDFSGIDGKYPSGSLISDGTFLYAMTSHGGTNNTGVIFKYRVGSIFSISGAILTEIGTTISGATVILSGDDTQTATTDSTGRYSFNVTANGNYTITPSKNNDVVPNNGITGVDVLLMRRHILGTPLNSPYKIIAAAECNAAGDTLVSTADILLTRQLILGSANSYPTNRLWQFVPNDYVFPDVTNPFPFPTTRTYTNITTNQTGQDFIGIKLGDVNNSWDANIP